MSELTVTLLRYGFLALLWVFIAAVVFSQARDLTVNGRARAAARAGSARAAGPSSSSSSRARWPAAATSSAPPR